MEISEYHLKARQAFEGSKLATPLDKPEYWPVYRNSRIVGKVFAKTWYEARSLALTNYGNSAIVKELSNNKRFRSIENERKKLVSRAGVGSRKVIRERKPGRKRNRQSKQA